MQCHLECYDIYVKYLLIQTASQLHLDTRGTYNDSERTWSLLLQPSRITEPPPVSHQKPSQTLFFAVSDKNKMVSKRQREARKRYKAEHPELFPKPEPTPPKDPNKKKKKKSNFKRRKVEENDPNRPIKKGFKKHPLRVPGMKPGESCFICKDKGHIAKLCPERARLDKKTVCFDIFLIVFSHLGVCLYSWWNYW